jgi:hypothetical protein
MNRPFPHFDIARLPNPTGMIPAIAGSARRLDLKREARSAPNRVIDFPKRPDLSVLNETIPLFYIGQNKKGLWVVREAEGRSGGLFLLRRTAVRFAREQGEAAGCGLMFLNKPLELDIENRGSDIVEPLAAAMDAAKRRTPRLAGLFGMAVTQWRKLVARMSRALAEEQRNRLAIERELFHGQYWLSSKSDDDLPVAD